MDTRGTDVDTIRAVLRNGVIQPLDPLPEGWAEGQELQVVGPEPPANRERIEVWYRETDVLAEELYDPKGFADFEAAIVEADREAKAWMRREMGLE